MQPTKQHQERGVHCDLQVQRLASSSAVNYLNGRNVPFCQAIKNGMMKEQIVACTVAWSSSRLQTVVWRPIVFSQGQVLQYHLCIYIHGCIVCGKCPDWRKTGKRLSKRSRRRVQVPCSRNNTSPCRYVSTRRIKNTKLCPVVHFRYRYGSTINIWFSIMNGSGREIVATIQCVLRQVNKFFEMFLWSGELIRGQEVIYAQLAIHEAPGVHLRTYIRQTCKELVAILLYEKIRGEQDITLHQRGAGLQRIAKQSRRTIHFTSFTVATWWTGLAFSSLVSRGRHKPQQTLSFMSCISRQQILHLG